ncbi:hypothetical protein Gogos_000892 [Gossypium gossypioides]|uniref:Uncharacterized protein n=1 Tax=Gossypium gossypioides TaxID=34282 RepID=A0A7J9CUE9_GOSGO|nr:hypothetical protein [Gossypium gossypioides]
MSSMKENGLNLRKTVLKLTLMLLLVIVESDIGLL